MYEESYGGGIANAGTLILNASTVTQNSIPYCGKGGGIANVVYSYSGTLILDQSIVAGNEAAVGPDIYDPSATSAPYKTLSRPASLGYNLIGDGSDSNITPNTGDLIGTAEVPIDAMLNALKDNDGPTMSHSLKVGSPARDAIPAALCFASSDQRNLPRPADGDGAGPNDCDIGAFEAQSPLPVELFSFNATVEEHSVHLSWQTATETNNAGFEVQMRIDETRLTPGSQGDQTASSSMSTSQWKILDWIEGSGTTQAPRLYQYQLSNLEPGLYAFRLKQVDFDGGFAYSKEVLVSIGVLRSHFLSAVYPNPIFGTGQFSLITARSQPIVVFLYDSLGRRMRTLHEGVVRAGVLMLFRLDSTALPAGLYLIQVRGEQFEESRSVLVVR